jgi:predicted nucleic acid-binding protein
MVFVDTSVWIDFFRGRANVVSVLSMLLDNRQVAMASPVWLEILNGAKKSEVASLSRLLSAIPRYNPTEESWITCERWIEVAIGKGKRFAIPDLLIASVVAQNDGVIWSLDQDFNQMSTLGFLKLFDRH